MPIRGLPVPPSLGAAGAAGGGSLGTLGLVLNLLDAGTSALSSNAEQEQLGLILQEIRNQRT